MYLQWEKAVYLQMVRAVYLQFVELVLGSKLRFGYGSQTLGNAGF